MSKETLHENMESGGIVLRQTVPDFVPSRFRPKIPEQMARARVSVALMQVNNPFFYETRDFGGTSLDWRRLPTGLETYGLGNGMQVRDNLRMLADMGIKDRKSVEREFGSGLLYRADRLLEDGVVGNASAVDDLKLLAYLDSSAGAIVARLKGSMSLQAEIFREETHKIIGNPLERYVVRQGQSQVEIVLPKDSRMVSERESLEDQIKSLSSKELSGWMHMVRLFGGKIKGPHARQYLSLVRAELGFN